MSIKINLIPHFSDIVEKDAYLWQAIVKRNDGIVQVIKDLCDSCEACAGAYPEGAIQYDAKK